MKVATISQTKNQLSALIDRVRHGETVIITDRDRPVARLEPVVADTDASGRLLRLERAGVLRRGTGGPDPEILDDPPPKPEPGGDILEALVAEREESR